MSLRKQPLCLLSTAVVLTSISAARAELVLKAPPKLPEVFSKELPRNIDDLRAIEQHVQQLAKRLSRCTVGIRIGAGQGSGVIIDKEGYVLTAGHVSGQPGRRVNIILHDGRIVKGKTLGANRGIDSGLIKIIDEGEYPYAEKG